MKRTAKYTKRTKPTPTRTPDPGPRPDKPRADQTPAVANGATS